MSWRAELRNTRWWAARVIFALLVVFSGFLAWLWISAAMDKPFRFYHSTDRYCSYIGFVSGRFMVHYDGGPDHGIVTKRNWQFAGVFWNGQGGALASWQQLEFGLHGWFAVGLLGVAWPLAAWYFIGIPIYRRRRGRCVRCAYDLAAIPSPVCPECGLPIPAKRMVVEAGLAPTRASSMKCGYAPGKHIGLSQMESQEPIILTFIPALVVILLEAEKQKGSPLTEQEALSIRDNGVCIALPRSAAIAVAEKRGYEDLDPEHAWEHWQAARIKLAASAEPREG